MRGCILRLPRSWRLEGPSTSMAESSMDRRAKAWSIPSGVSTSINDPAMEAWP